MRLIAALTISCSDSISHALLETAEDLLKRFVRPLWAYTCYKYEDLNGKILNLIHGTTHIDTQIANSQNQYIKMMRLMEALPGGDLREFCL
ncbi:hypothetical protein PV327_004058 [Microctonus hyperodae]|uniref:Uncharacterized protein n=1 Tax=Microctonus hyperodae TaxID=165561 RepID=A0AA39FBX5_MICHY|nr:hypothetical protein PV327_004058 [Microctonus hyperodae]